MGSAPAANAPAVVAATNKAPVLARWYWLRSTRFSHSQACPATMPSGAPVPSLTVCSRAARRWACAGWCSAAWASALAAGDFRPSGGAPRDWLRGLLGGVLLGWGSLLALGCTVGTLLSGVMAGAASGWVFGLFCLVGTVLGLKLRPLLRLG